MFAVWGVSWTDAAEEARKKTPIVDESGNQLGETEYYKRLNEQTQKQFDKMRLKQISPLYGSRKFAELYARLLREHGVICRDICIKQKTNNVQDKRTRTGKIKTAWV